MEPGSEIFVIEICMIIVCIQLFALFRGNRAHYQESVDIESPRMLFIHSCYLCVFLLQFVKSETSSTDFKNQKHCCIV